MKWIIIIITGVVKLLDAIVQETEPVHLTLVVDIKILYIDVRLPLRIDAISCYNKQRIVNHLSPFRNKKKVNTTSLSGLI